MNWHRTPRARLLLQSCVTNPPIRRVVPKSYAQSIDYTVEYEGWQVEALEKLCAAAGTKALAKSDDGDPADFIRWCAIGSVNEILERLLVNGSIERARQLAGISEQMEAA